MQAKDIFDRYVLDLRTFVRFVLFTIGFIFFIAPVLVMWATEILNYSKLHQQDEWNMWYYNYFLLYTYVLEILWLLLLIVVGCYNRRAALAIASYYILHYATYAAIFCFVIPEDEPRMWVAQTRKFGMVVWILVPSVFVGLALYKTWMAYRAFRVLRQAEQTVSTLGNV